MSNKFFLKIGDVQIAVQSDIAMEPLTGALDWRFTHFLTDNAASCPDISLNLTVIRRWQSPRSAALLFRTFHNKRRNWDLWRKKDTYILTQYTATKRITACLNTDFT